MGLLDKAAACVAAYEYEATCPSSDEREQICRMICCCNKHPIIKVNKLKQLCVDKLIEANGLNKDGILGGVPYDMETGLPAEGYPRATIAAQLKKYLDGAYYTNRLRIPDVTVLKDPTGPITKDNLKKLYEIKFPHDRERPNQIPDYNEIADTEVLRVEDCNCDNRAAPESIPVPEAVRQASIDRANSILIKYIEQNKTEIFQALGEAGMAKEAQGLLIEYDRATNPNFFSDVLKIAIPFPWGKIGGRLGKIPTPKSLPPASPVPAPVLK